MPIMTTIQKFGTKSGLIETNAKVIVLVDEGHRTQYKFNAAAMSSDITLVPKRVYILHL
jgi:type I site-specific restriction-modification system R (restriction) subunit